VIYLIKQYLRKRRRDLTARAALQGILANRATIIREKNEQGHDYLKCIAHDAIGELSYKIADHQEIARKK